MINCDLIIKNISQLITPVLNNNSGNQIENTLVKNCHGGAYLKIISPAEVGIKKGKIVYAGSPWDNLQVKNEGKIIDARGLIALPAFVDPHTHLIFSGYRAEEFHLRLQGTTYLEILRRGGGILSTVKKVRDSSFEELYQDSKNHLLTLVENGTTTIEVKSGYGLDLENEVKMLEVTRALNNEGIARFIPTFMGLHAVPSEYQGKTREYVEYMTDEVLPIIAEKKLAHFVDVFVEKGVFSPEEALPFLEKSLKLGFKIRLHADEFSDIGAIPLACRVGAVTAEHLLTTSDASLLAMAKNKVMAILLPGTIFSLGLEGFPFFNRFQKAGLKVALGTDFNPGTSMTESMEFIISLAVTRLKMPLEDAIVASTLHGATSLGLEDITGSLETGKSADLIFLNLPNYQHLGYRQGISHVKAVFFAGKLVSTGYTKLGKYNF
ncbi:MAG: Imidazolonepropionase [candidate division WS2 bacterium]|uniref:Imidazolonepropionase n=1 Tax=Psychracetigena formicireducens TaxID=2986056 RepID=A0A9E2F229_PSYF1|nr:Imidazolonepropionase [Candidatus Psychracetigena formicireducens]MBT9145257.1 Imidazolonepropionase [Candidatus Psychracetigena formicireducens]MBT9150786.1 Imidazolonepropionase [Candidatus Psychracetigena formicireducens]